MKSSVFLLVCCIVAHLCSCVMQKHRCPPELSRDITDSDYDSFTGSRTVDNITYSQYDYYVDKGVIRGCVCDIRTCVRKCCPKNEEIGPSKNCIPVMNERNFSDVVPNNFTYENVYSFLKCENKFRFQLYPIKDREAEKFVIHTSGDLIYKELNISVSDYCLAYFSDIDVTGALICVEYQKEEPQQFYYYGKITIATTIDLLIIC